MARRSATATKKKPRKGQQLELPRTNWGGRRRGAGRKPRPGGKTGAPHRRRPWHDRRHPVHVSLKVDPDELPSLRQPHLAPAIVDCLREVREKHAKTKDFRVVHYSIQDSHLHLVLEAKHRQALTRGMQGLAIRVARRINKALNRRGKVFVDRYFEVPLTSPRQTRNGLAYVLLNKRRHWHQQGVRWDSGWIDPCTSAAYFDGWSCLKTRPPPGERPPVCRPRTWMLRVGWRRHGRIHPDEVPGARAGR